MDNYVYFMVKSHIEEDVTDGGENQGGGGTTNPPSGELEG